MKGAREQHSMILAHISGSRKLLLSIACAVVTMKLELENAIKKMSRGGDRDEKRDQVGC